MSVPRQPDSPIRDARRTRRSRDDVAGPADLITQAADAANVGETESALGLLVRVAAGLAPTRLPDLAERLLVELGQSESAAPTVRAQALRLYARSRRTKDADADARSALQQACALAPDPDLLVDLVAVTHRLDGTGPAEALVHEGLDRWPDDATLRALSVSLAYEAGDAQRVRDLLDDALRRHPDHPDMLELLARLELAEGRPEPALEPARRLVVARPAVGRALLAVALHQLGRLADDLALLDAVLANRPDDPWLLTGVARALLDEDRPGDALTLLDAAHGLAPDDLEVCRTRGLTSAMLGDYPTAMADLEQAARAGSDPWLVSMRAEVTRAAGDPRTALALFAELDPADEPAWVAASRAAAHASLGELDAARSLYELALSRDPADVNALCGLAEIELDHDGDRGVAAAEEQLQRAVLLAPESARAHATLGEVLRRTDRPAEAVAAFDRALELVPDYAYALASKGQALLAMGRRDDGLDALAAAAAQAPTTTWILDTLVEELAGGEYTAVDAVLGRVQRILRSTGGDQLPVLVHRAELARRHGELPIAERFYRKAREIVPDDGDLGRKHISALLDLGREEEALSVLNALPGARGSDPEWVWMRVQVLWSLERLPEVRTELEVLAAGEPPVPYAVGALGELQRVDGRRDEARALLTRVLDADRETRAYALASLGVLERDDNDVTGARRHLRDALDLDAANAFAFLNLISLELAEGHADRVEALLEELDRSGVAEREVAMTRATALYGLGDYSRALEAVEAYLLRAGDTAVMLRLQGWLRVGLGQLSRAASSFRAAAELADVPSGVVDTAAALCRVSLWTEALRIARRAAATGNPFGEVALAGVWGTAGAYATAAEHALRGFAGAPQSPVAAMYAARTQRSAGDPRAALAVVAPASDRWPHEAGLEMERGECLLETGDEAAAQAVFEDLLARLTRQVHRDADDLLLQGACLLRLRRATDATQVLLQALSASDRTATALLDLVHASLLDGDLRQAVVLEHRAVEEIARLPVAVRRGLLAGACHDLTVLAGRLEPDAGRAVGEVLERLRAREAELAPQVATLGADVG